MFNRLEAIATEAIPKTPVLGCRISNGLQPHRLGSVRTLYDVLIYAQSFCCANLNLNFCVGFLYRICMTEY
jgi:hypothetical protein